MGSKLGILWVLFVGGLATVANPQQQANYELAEKFNAFTAIGNFSENSLGFHPREINDTDNFWFDYRTSAGNFYYYVTPDRGKQELLFDNDEMAMALSELTRERIDPKDLKFYDLMFAKNQKSFTFEYGRKAYEYNRITRKLKEVEKKQVKDKYYYSDKGYSPDKKYILYAKNHNLYVKGNKELGVDTTEVQLTFDGMQHYSYASKYYDFYPDMEMSTNARWCNDSRHVYFVMEDERKLHDFWVINSLSDKPELVKYKYEFPGDRYVTQYELIVIDVVEKTARKVNIAKWPDQYVMVFSSSSKGDLLFVERTKRTWDEVDVCSVNTSTLEVKELIHEVDKPYRDVHARSVEVLNDGKDILFRSERTGWGHYYHYDGSGNLKNTITSGPWVSGHIVAIDTLQREIYFYGYGGDPKMDPCYYQLYKSHIDREGVTQITKEDAQHQVHFLKSRRYFIDSFSRVDMEPRTLLKDNTGKVILEFPKPDLTQVYAKGWKKPKRFVVKAADNLTDLYGVMWKPSNFDPEKKYPIISIVYPGPYYGFVPTNFTLDDNYCTRMAQLGFIVITVGHRGDTPMRGKAYHRYGYNRMRDYPLADDKYAIEQLAQRHSFIDIDRVGIYGHSGGGLMAAAAICSYPDFYKAAVSCSGNHDNNIFNRGWGEC